MNELLDTVFSQPNSNVSENSPLLRHEYTNSSRILTFVVYFCTDWPWETVDYINMQKRGDAQTEDPTTRTPQATGAAATDHNVREEIRTPQATVAAGNGTGIQQNGQPSEESHGKDGVITRAVSIIIIHVLLLLLLLQNTVQTSNRVLRTGSYNNTYRTDKLIIH